MTYILIGLAAAAVWLYFSARGKAGVAAALQAKSLAEPWFSANKIKSSTVVFGAYNAQGLARNPGATVLVGVGEDMDGGNPIGFAVEVMEGKGLLVGEILRPYGTATWHRMASQTALAANRPLIDVLLANAAAHREAYNQE